LLILAIFGYALVIAHHGASDANAISIVSIASHVGNEDQMVVSINIRNNERSHQKVKVAWYLSYPGDQTPWETGLFASSWQVRNIAPSAVSNFRSTVTAAIPRGTYQITAIVHEYVAGKEVQIGEEASTKFVHIANRTNFYRASSPGPAMITEVRVPKNSSTDGQILHIAAAVSVRSTASLKLPIRLSWALIDANSFLSNSWITTPPLFLGPKYPVLGHSSTINISSNILGAPRQKYTLRLELFVGLKLSDSVVVPSLRFSTGGLNPSIIRGLNSAAFLPLVVTSTLFASELETSSNSTVSVTVTNTKSTPSTGQLILQVGRIGDPEPWKDPVFTFPIITFTVPANTAETVQDTGLPPFPDGTYELGIYVHDKTATGQYQSGDQVFARSHFKVYGSPSIIRGLHSPVSLPLVITSTSFPSMISATSSSTVSVTVTNTASTPSTGQLILQVGRIGDPEPWKDPVFTFPIITFTVPANTAETVQDTGLPPFPDGTYELGIYVHDKTATGQYQSGDQVFARSHFKVYGTQTTLAPAT
jgi:hypothetical protein